MHSFSLPPLESRFWWSKSPCGCFSPCRWVKCTWGTWSMLAVSLIAQLGTNTFLKRYLSGWMDRVTLWAGQWALWWIWFLSLSWCDRLPGVRRWHRWLSSFMCFGLSHQNWFQRTWHLILFPFRFHHFNFYSQSEAQFTTANLRCHPFIPPSETSLHLPKTYSQPRKKHKCSWNSNSMCCFMCGAWPSSYAQPWFLCSSFGFI